jgi:NAD(P)H-hydrate epimerase
MDSVPVATCDEIRTFDRYAIEELGIPGIVLMENAGRQIADAARAMLRDLKGRRVLVLAGRGNNGGDGFVVARHLAMDGLAVEPTPPKQPLPPSVAGLLRRTGRLRRLEAVLLARRDQVRGDARTNLDILDAMGLAVSVLDGPPDAVVRQLEPMLKRADLVIDGLLGTGTQGEVREPYASIIAAVNAAGRPVLAIDIPSGLDGDTGRPLGPTIHARRTVTMAAMKIGFQNPEAAAYTGTVVLADIGVPFRRIAQD